MNALDELADTVLNLPGNGDDAGAQPAQPALDDARMAPAGGCLQDLADLHAWRPHDLHAWLT